MKKFDDLPDINVSRDELHLFGVQHHFIFFEICNKQNLTDRKWLIRVEDNSFNNKTGNYSQILKDFIQYELSENQIEVEFSQKFESFWKGQMIYENNCFVFLVDEQENKKSPFEDISRIIQREFPDTNVSFPD